MPISTFLDGRQPTQLRGLAFLALSDIGQVLTQTSTDDGGGGASQAWNLSGTIACRVDDLSGSEQLSAGRISDRTTHVITVPPNVVPTPADRFLIAGKGTFEITAVRNRTREWLQMLEAAQVMAV